MEDYKRIGSTAIHIVPSDNSQNKYMTLVYDHKQYMWRNADIYANEMETCIEIAKIVFNNTDTIHDDDLNITIDYGDVSEQ